MGKARYVNRECLRGGMVAIVAFCLSALALAGDVPALSASAGPDYPRIIGMYIGGPSYYDQPAMQRQFSKHDVLIIGFYRGWESDGRGPRSMRQVVRSIKALNPNILVGQYTILQEAQDSPAKPFREKAAKLNKEDWWLRNATGERVRWTERYQGWDINITGWSRPDARGDRYPQWLARSDYEAFFRPVPEFDIWYLDNALSRPAARTADWDGDGRDDQRNDAAIARAYRIANVDHWRKIRELRQDVVLMGNTDDLAFDEYSRQLEGAFLESLIGESWSTETRSGWGAVMQRYRMAMSRTRVPHIVGFNVHGRADDYRAMRYGLASCLLDNGYFSYTETGSDYLSVSWFDEFDVSLGQPIDPPPTQAWQNGVYRRRFERGMVLLNPGLSRATVEVGPMYKRIKGTQDATVNNGRSETSITLPGRDGLILVSSSP